MAACSKCPKPSYRAIIAHTEEAPPLGQKDNRHVRIFRLCKDHWREMWALLGAA